MSLGIVFLAGYPTVKLLCNANTHSVFSLPFSYLTSDVHLKEVWCSDMGARPRPLYFASQNILDSTVTRSCARLASQNNSGTLTVTRSCTRLLIPEKNLELEVEDRQKRAATAFFPRILDFFRHRHNTIKTQHNMTMMVQPSAH
jgi:hypothetical protein